MGSDRLMTHLNETEVKSKTEVKCKRLAASLQSIENILNDETVTRNMRK